MHVAHAITLQGWLPRSGLLYGVDYVLYQMHPLAVHSEFGVMLVPLSGPYRPDLNWLDVQITNRLINQVGGLCGEIWSAHSFSALSLPSNLSKANAQARLHHLLRV